MYLQQYYIELYKGEWTTKLKFKFIKNMNYRYLKKKH